MGSQCSSGSAALLSLAVLFLAPMPASAQVIDLGEVTSGTESGAQVWGLSGDGSTVVGKFNFHAFRWTQPSGMQDLGVLGTGFSSEARATSYDGSTVVGISYPTGSTTAAFQWRAPTGTVGLPNLPFAPESAAMAVSHDGQVSAGWAHYPGDSSTIATRWIGGTPQLIGPLTGTGVTPATSRVTAVSGDGVVFAGYASTINGQRGFRWTAAGGFQLLQNPPTSNNTTINGISADGSTVVGEAIGGAFRWNALGVVQGFDTLPGGYIPNHANAANADGTIIVGSAMAFSSKAFIWTAGGGTMELSAYLSARGIDVTGWTFGEARGISDSGNVIAGSGLYQGHTHLWALVVPSPGSCVLPMASIAVLGRRRRAIR